MVVRMNNDQVSVCMFSQCSIQCLCLIKLIQTRVRIGMIIQILGDVSLQSHFLNIDLNQSIILIIPKNIEIVIKNIEKNNAIITVVSFWLIAADAENPTHTIANANTQII